MDIIITDNNWDTDGYIVLESDNIRYKIYRYRQFGSNTFHDKDGVLLYGSDMCIGRFDNKESVINYLSKLE